MADYNSSLPVRTENDGDVVVKVSDATVPSQQLAVNADGSINITDNGGSLTVDAVDLDIRDLDSAQDSVEVLQATHDNLNANANIQVGDADVANGNPVPVSDAGGSLTVDAVNLDIRDLVFATDKVDVTGSQVGVTNLPTTVDTNYGAVGASTIRTASQIGNATGAANFGNGTITAQTLRTASVITDGTDTLAVNTDGSINVNVIDSVPNTPVNDYNTAAAVAGGGTDTHTYTSTGNFYLTQIEATSSGKLKIEVQVDGTTVFVQFNSTANPNMHIRLSQPILVPNGDTVDIIRTNRDNQAQDVYSTISGYIE